MFVAFIFFCLSSCNLSGVFGESVSVMEGNSVTLYTDAAEIQIDDLILWTFGPHDILIAKINRQNNKSRFYDENAEGRFRDRLKLDHQTGSLTIINSRTTDSGLYKVTSSRTRITLNTFNLSVYPHLPISFISNSSVSRCVLLCSSAVNVSHVTLSWVKGSSLLSSISVSDLSISVSLPLEVEYQDRNTYSCVINDPIRNQTQHLNITQLCHTCADCTHCGFTVIRLVHLALVGVAIVAVLFYELRSKSQQKSMQK
ncbi:uncharacterized protein [Chanodichthys erythropterus]|uniref:uncharacterized protein n=1 Tax=Chanodichthys erythropterus TaxID=933992 RepID=UPI00351DDDF6